MGRLRCVAPGAFTAVGFSPIGKFLSLGHPAPLTQCRQWRCFTTAAPITIQVMERDILNARVLQTHQPKWIRSSWRRCTDPCIRTLTTVHQTGVTPKLLGYFMVAEFSADRDIMETPYPAKLSEEQLEALKEHLNEVHAAKFRDHRSLGLGHSF